MKTIVLFGGSFDPPHNGHLAMGLLVREKFSPDKVILSVSKNPLKSNSPTCDSDRLALVSIFAEELNYTGDVFVVSDWELNQLTPSYSVDTLQRLSIEFPGARLMLMIGEDNFQIFHRWKNHLEIFNLAELIVFGREEFHDNQQFSPPPSAKIHWLSLSVDEASTEIREKLSKGITPKGEMPLSILNFVLSKNLYR